MRTIFLLPGLLLALCAASPAAAQSVLNLQPGSEILIDGTSNRSDWTVHATEVTGSITFGQADNAVTQTRIVVPTPKVVSKSSAIMDRLIKDALKAGEHPEIVYELTKAEPAGAPQGNTFTLKTQGTLTLAGVTKPIEMDVTCERQADGTVSFTGSHALKMSDYGIQPPSAMFGALHTGDEVTIRFDVAGTPDSAL